ncbi:hypothetical protein Clacol_005024 [Clathrus columnatus]|uniref:F-box domain-containing protein n=1 Tax=Clathrus columnatus TaxID=1419009 RepID=A0AAV5ACQ5_9AGAM|nr:hypothetical protein Clacol_005024 [Clathrus columnatus]
MHDDIILPPLSLADMQPDECVSYGGAGIETIDTRIPLLLKEIDEKREWINKYLISLNQSHNTLIPINQVTSDILYKIFTLTVFDSETPGTAILDISHVCTHWKKLALEFPNLWGFLDFNFQKISSLFLERSKGSPITMCWSTSHLLFEKQGLRSEFSEYGSTEYLESHLYLLPRVNQLTLHLSFVFFEKVLPLLQSVGPLRLQSLHINIFPDGVQNPAILWLDPPVIDITRLLVLDIRGFSPPWTIQSRQNLTHLLISELCLLPSPTQLLTFLSHCPSLIELEIDFTDTSRHTNVISEQTALESAPPLLDFPHLTILKLSAEGIQSHLCIRNILLHMRVQHQLRFFYAHLGKLDATVPQSRSANLLELASSGILSHFTNTVFLSIFLDLPRNSIHIQGSCSRSASDAPFVQRNAPITPDSPCFSFDGNARQGQPFNNNSIINPVIMMPNVQHLQLAFSALELLTSWSIDLPALLPHLTTLDLRGRHYLGAFNPDSTVSLKALMNFPTTLKLQTLILKGMVFNSSVLPEVIFKTGITNLQIFDCNVDPKILAIIRERGAEVIVGTEDVAKSRLHLW